jgi:soluble lytic murein transglycosylase
MKQTHKKRWLLLLLIIAVGIVVTVNLTAIERWIYPVKYKQNIDYYAAKNELNPLLVAAIIRAESNYKPHLISPKGAVGLMQLMPDTATWAAEKMGIMPPTSAQLHEEQQNIEIGTWYLKTLRNQFDGNEAAMIAAYNAGPTNVRKWLNDNVWEGRFESADKIPFGETKKYVGRVQHFFNKYEKLYGTGLQLTDADDMGNTVNKK